MPFIFILIVVLIVFSVPLTEIIFKSDLGKVWAEKMRQGTSQTETSKLIELEKRLEKQEEIISELQRQNLNLEEKYSFLERLLEEPKK